MAKLIMSVDGEDELLELEDYLYEPTPEDEYHFWSGEGHITFFVEQNIPGVVFEIQIEDHSGCAGGAQETVGLDYLIKEMLDLDIKKLKEGVTYTLQGLTVVHTRGDGWTTDDDSDYYYKVLTYRIEPLRYLKQKLTNFWWEHIGWRIHARRNR